MDAATLARCTGASTDRAALFAQPLSDVMARYQIDSPRRQAAFLATLAIESNKLARVEEDLYYTHADVLAGTFGHCFASPSAAEPYLRNPQALGKLVYGGYWGRGLIQLSLRANYQAAATALSFDYINHPELLLEPQHAALTAGWFWDTHNCNPSADAGDMRGVTLHVNGKALLKLADRTAQYLTNLSFLTAAAEAASWGNEARR